MISARLLLSRSLQSLPLRSSLIRSSLRSFSFTPLSPKNLGQVVDIDKLMKEETGTIEAIWIKGHGNDNDDSITNDDQRHVKKNTMASALTLHANDGNIVKKRALASPMFIIPLFKGTSDSFLLLLSQYQENNGFILTYLEEYKRNADTASPWMSLMLYSDLETTKDITLLRSDYTPNVTRKENAIISQMLVDAYRVPEIFNAHVHIFNKEPSKFDFDRYLTDFKTRYSSLFINDTL